MRTSAAGRALIEQREGRRLTAYRDSKGVLTIGVGHTGRMSAPEVTVGMTITEAECDALLATDLAPVEACINRVVTVPLGQNEFDALASLGFNIGIGGLATSTVVKKLNIGDVDGAAAAFMLWNHPAVLEGRRDAERKQFLDPDGSASGVAAARATTLAAKAAMTRASVPRTAGGGVLVAAAGTAATVATATAHHGPLAILFGGLIGLGAAIDGAVAWSRNRTATVLTANAAKQAAAVPAPAHA